jgi:hypothetical protein
LFVGNLAEAVDEKQLYDALSAVGTVVDAPYVMRDPDTGASKGYGFFQCVNLEASDAALAAMNGQCTADRPIVVQCALKQDGDGGGRHGAEAGRTLAAATSSVGHGAAGAGALLRPHTMFDKPRLARSPLPGEMQMPVVREPDAIQPPNYFAAPPPYHWQQRGNPEFVSDAPVYSAASSMPQGSHAGIAYNDMAYRPNAFGHNGAPGSTRGAQHSADPQRGPMLSPRHHQAGRNENTWYANAAPRPSARHTHERRMPPPSR